MNKNDKPLDVMIVFLKNIAHFETDTKFVQLKLNNPLPLTQRDDIIKMSKLEKIYLSSSHPMRVYYFLEQLKSRYRFQNLINYYDSFLDEINLNCKFIYNNCRPWSFIRVVWRFIDYSAYDI